MTPWKYTDATHRVVFRILDDGSMQSELATNRDVLDWLAAPVSPPNAILDPDPPVLSQTDQDIAAAKAYQKLVALMGMTPAQVQAWVATNVTTLAQAQDAIATLAIAVGILARRL